MSDELKNPWCGWAPGVLIFECLQRSRLDLRGLYGSAGNNSGDLAGGGREGRR
jgi:hypothetical protein